MPPNCPVQYTMPRVTRLVTEHHQEALHTVAEYMKAFKLAGLDTTYDEEGLNGRGLYIATRP